MRALTARGLKVIGVDAVPAFSDDARAQGGEFHVADNTARAGRHLHIAPCGAAVCNFCLLGDRSVTTLLRALPHYLLPGGWLGIQALHPVAAGGSVPYVDGWRDGSWAGCGEAFTEPPPWYFRTLSSWRSLLRVTGYDLVECREPTVPGVAAPCAVLFIARTVTA